MRDDGHATNVFVVVRGLSRGRMPTQTIATGTWKQNGQTGGQIACGTYKNYATLTWTTDAKNVLGHLTAANSDVNALYQWWRTNG